MTANGYKVIGKVQISGSVPIITAEERQQAVRELYFWHCRGLAATNFTACLYRLFEKADTRNFLRLERGFPAEASVWREWLSSHSAPKFFDKYGF